MNLIQRVKNMLVQPKQEWQAINGETNSGMPLVINYLLPLALVAALATFIGFAFITRFGTVRWGLMFAIITLVQLVLSVFINAYVTDALAPSFGSEKNINKSIQLVVYASTPVLVGSILGIVPDLRLVGAILGGAYSIYLLYLGLPILKKTPEDKVPIYLIVIILVLFILYWLISMLLVRALLPGYYGMVRL